MSTAIFLTNISALSLQDCRKEDEEYKALQEKKIEGIYEKYPKVLAVFDSETESELTEKECSALIEVMEIQRINSRTWRCRRCTSVVAMTAWVISKKQGFYNGLTEKKTALA